MEEIIKINAKIVSVGDQNISQDIINKIFKYDISRLSKEQTFNNIIKKYLFDDTYLYIRSYDTKIVDSYDTKIVNLKLFKNGNSFVLYVLLCLSNQTRVREIDNNILIPEYVFSCKYICIATETYSDIDDIIKIRYDNTIFELILYYDSPNIYEFKDNLDINVLEYKKNKIIFFENKSNFNYMDLVKLRGKYTDWGGNSKIIIIKNNVLVCD